jgi:hypothetical protein
MTVRGMLVLPDGAALRIGHDGLLVGRHRTCDLQLTDVGASRRHALLRIADDAIELIQLGRQPLEVNGQPCSPVQPLADGDRLRLPGLECRVRVEHLDDAVRITHALLSGGKRFPIRATPFVVGSGPSARMVFASWPEQAMCFRVVQDALFVEVVAGVHINGEPAPTATPIELQVGDQLALADETLQIEEVHTDDATTERGHTPGPPTAIVLAPLPRGGRVTFSFSDGDRAVYLPGRRYQLVAALAAKLGELISDHDLVPLVWNDTDEVGDRQSINVLVTRCRHDLIGAGIAVAIERAPGGRATRLVVAPGAQVTIAPE